MEATYKLMLIKRRLQKMKDRPKLLSSSFASYLSGKYSLDAIEMANNMRLALHNKFPQAGQA
jgi:hypothetical protein